MTDIITLGEALIDFVPTESGVSLKAVPGFHRRFGGAPANVAIGLARLGGNVGFIGKVGEDSFGDFLKDKFKDEGVDVRGLYRTSRANTTLAFVSLTEEGERDFVFYRNPGADELLEPKEIKEDYIESAEVLHFGSLSLTRKETRKATIRAIKYARRHEVTVTMDPNIRLNLWEDENRLQELVLDLAEEVNLMKLSKEEVFFLTGMEDLVSGTNRLLELGPELIVVTLGAKGCFLNYRDSKTRISGHDVEVQDTTGAGDGFMAGALKKLLKDDMNLTELEKEDAVEALRFGNAAAALTTTGYGAISSFPTYEEVESFLEKP
ncbi:carbohydrate kinase [Candidatus Bipolaricaulota bacterium]|nr:carbohydrate kinase [Candidatus Bipolaricaulota bacterium]